MSAPLDDVTLIEEADSLFLEGKLLDAAERLNQVEDSKLLTPKHHWMLQWVTMVQEGMNDLLTSPDLEGSKWKKQGESHGHRDFTVHYHHTDDNQLECRIDSVIESSLLIPFISVLNESDLFVTWMPSFKTPIKMGVQSSIKLKEEARGNQIIRVTASMPWPFKPRECTQHAVAVDAIDDHGAIVVQVLTESPESNPDIPESAPGVVKIDLRMNMLIRGCPVSHPLLEKSRHKYPNDEELILISMRSWVDPHVGGIPVSVINFISRTVFGRIWSALLGVAEQVREGKRLQHKEAINSNRILYDWLEHRIGAMMEKVKEGSNRGGVEQTNTDTILMGSTALTT